MVIVTAPLGKHDNLGNLRKTSQDFRDKFNIFRIEKNCIQLFYPQQ